MGYSQMAKLAVPKLLRNKAAAGQSSRTIRPIVGHILAFNVEMKWMVPAFCTVRNS